MPQGWFYFSVLVFVFALCPIVIISTLFITAPYGRHARSGWGPKIDTRWLWLIMESPAVFGFITFYFLGPRALEPMSLILLALWQSHYIHRTLIYPWRMRASQTRTPFLIAGMAILFNLCNAYVNATHISSKEAGYTLAWLYDPRFILGVALFAWGYFINRQSDEILRNLRKPGETEYKIPHGGFYKWLSCPNYFGEFMIWAGWAIATWSLAGLSFFLFTVANLLPRAISNHRWYIEKFPDYPKERKAVFPFIL
ncbi:MAG: DUF1295 domain-containing protein [Myxococcales bacterium]|nr:DUF1295 domain-containing protein [Myxococcales bacterium]